MTKVLFIDESGDHNLDKLDPQYPVFVLAGVLFDLRYAKTILETEVNRLKVKHFGRTDIILHTADIIRNRNGFEVLKDEEARALFFADLNELMRRLDYTVVACGIKKTVYLARYGPTAIDPYEQSLNVLVERFCYEIGGYGETGWIIAECRGELLDRPLLRVWDAIRDDGTYYVSGETVQSRIQGMALREKSRNIAGLQIADLVASPIGRHLLEKPTREDFRIIESKLRRRDSDDYIGPGLVILP